MGLPILAVAKLNLMSGSCRGLSPLGAILLWTFVLRLGSSSGLGRGAHIELLHAFRLFLFRMGRIVAREPADGDGTRWGRAVRRVWRRLARARSSPVQERSDEESLRALSMLAL